MRMFFRICRQAAEKKQEVFSLGNTNEENLIVDMLQKEIASRIPNHRNKQLLIACIQIAFPHIDGTLFSIESQDEASQNGDIMSTEKQSPTNPMDTVSAQSEGIANDSVDKDNKDGTEVVESWIANAVDKIISSTLTSKGVILTGPPCSGKSTCLKLAVKHLIDLRKWHLHKESGHQKQILPPKLSISSTSIRGIFVETKDEQSANPMNILAESFPIPVIYPKAMSLDQLYGYLEAGEWRDGVLPSLVRNSRVAIRAGHAASQFHLPGNQDLSKLMNEPNHEEVLSDSESEEGDESDELPIPIKTPRQSRLTFSLFKHSRANSRASRSPLAPLDAVNSVERIPPLPICTLDGPFDDTWGSVLTPLLDEYSSMMLLANSERLSMLPGSVMFFETPSLANLSPATLSRCSIIPFVDMPSTSQTGCIETSAFGVRWKDLVSLWQDWWSEKLELTDEKYVFLAYSVFDSKKVQARAFLALSKMLDLMIPSIEKWILSQKGRKVHQGLSHQDCPVVSWSFLLIIKSLLDNLDIYLEKLRNTSFVQTTQKVKRPSLRPKQSDLIREIVVETEDDGNMTKNATNEAVSESEKENGQDQNQAAKSDFDEKQEGNLSYREGVEEGKEEKRNMEDKFEEVSEAPVFTPEQAHANVFVFFLYHTICNFLDDDLSLKLEHLLRSMCDKETEGRPKADFTLPHISLEQMGLDLTSGIWQPWQKINFTLLHPNQTILGRKFPHLEDEYSNNPIEDKALHRVVIRTDRVANVEFWTWWSTARSKPLLFFGPSACGKTCIIRHALTRLEPEHQMYMHTCDMSEEASNLINVIENRLHKRRKSIYGPVIGSKLTIFLDDVNLLHMDEAKDQSGLELLRQIVEKNTWIHFSERSGFEIRSTQDVAWCVAIAPLYSSANSVSMRFTRQFTAVRVKSPSDQELCTVFQQLLVRGIQMVRAAYRVDSSMKRQDSVQSFENSLENEDLAMLNDISSRIARASITALNLCKKELPASTSHPHYVFDFRALVSVCFGLVRADLAITDSPRSLARLWVYEVASELGRRMSDENDVCIFWDILDRASSTTLSAFLPCSSSTRDDSTNIDNPESLSPTQELSSDSQQKFREKMEFVSFTGIFENVSESKTTEQGDNNQAASIDSIRKLSLAKKSIKAFRASRKSSSAVGNTVGASEGAISATSVRNEWILPSSSKWKLCEISSKQTLLDRTVELMDAYNADSVKPIDALVFDDMVQRLNQIMRVISRARGHLMLVGPGNSGRRSLVQLASFVTQNRYTQLSIAHLTLKIWRSHLQQMLKTAGLEGRHTVLHLCDLVPSYLLIKFRSGVEQKSQNERSLNEIAQEEEDSASSVRSYVALGLQVLNDLSQLLHSGSVPNLWNGSDLDYIYRHTLPYARAIKMPEYRHSVLSLFQTRVKDHIHVVLNCDADVLAIRLMMQNYPALGRNCTIQWTPSWETHSLKSICQYSLQNVDVGSRELHGKIIQGCVLVHEAVHQCLRKAYEDAIKSNFNDHCVVRKASSDNQNEILDPVGSFSKEEVTDTNLTGSPLFFGVGKRLWSERLCGIACFREFTNLIKSVISSRRLIVSQMCSKMSKGLERLLRCSQVIEDIQSSLNELLPTAQSLQDDLEVMVDEVAKLGTKASSTRMAMNKAALQLRLVLEPIESASIEFENSVQAIRDATKPEVMPEVDRQQNLERADSSIQTLVRALTAVNADFWSSISLKTLSVAQVVQWACNMKPFDIVESVARETGLVLQILGDSPDAIRSNQLSVQALAFWRALHEWLKALLRMRKASLGIALGEDIGELQLSRPQHSSFLNAREEMQVVEAKLNSRKPRVERKAKELIGINKEIESLQQRLTRSRKLLDLLQNEREYWTHTLEELNQELTGLVGDAIFASAFISYLGCVSMSTRHEIMKKWQQILSNLEIPYVGISTPMQVAHTLGYRTQAEAWLASGLSESMLDNVVTILATNHWPLIIDIDGEMLNWLKLWIPVTARADMNDESSIFVSVTDKQLDKHIESALSTGTILIVHDLLFRESWDPDVDDLQLDPLEEQNSGFKVDTTADQIVGFPEVMLSLVNRKTFVQVYDSVLIVIYL